MKQTSTVFDRERFLADLKRFIAFKTVVCQNEEEFLAANAWIKSFFDTKKTDFIEFECHGLTSTIIKPKDSVRPNMIGDGHIEVVPAEDEMFELREENGVLIGRGVADMKTQCLTMIWVLKRLIDEGEHNDFWIVFSEDEEIGSRAGVAVVVDYLKKNELLPGLVFAPDGGPDFSYVEKEKGVMTFEVSMPGTAAHASRPYLGDNAIDRMAEFYSELKRLFPNPRREEDWVVSLSMTTISAGEANNKIPDCCEAGFDLRLTEDHQVEDLGAQIREVADRFGAEIDFRQMDPATYYPKEAPIARKYLKILRQVSGREPQILHSSGASNGRLYVAQDPKVHVLMSSPRMGGAHSMVECLDANSLEAYYELVYATALLTAE